jgi:hypothetical protein
MSLDVAHGVSRMKCFLLICHSCCSEDGEAGNRRRESTAEREERHGREKAGIGALVLYHVE